MAFHGLSLGVIPFAVAGRPVWPLEAFTVFDDTRVYVELLSAQVTVTAPSEIVLYARAFEKLAGLAVYGEEARARINDAIGALLTQSQVLASSFPRQGSVGQPQTTFPPRLRIAGRGSQTIAPRARGQEHARPH